MKTKIEIKRYNSTYDFVKTNELEKQANECFGKDWEAEFDVEQIKELLNHIGRTDLGVNFIDGLDEDDIEVYSRKQHLSIDEINDLSVRIVGNLVNQGIIKDCTDTDDETEFDAQNQIRLVLGLKFGYTEEEIFN